MKLTRTLELSPALLLLLACGTPNPGAANEAGDPNGATMTRPSADDPTDPSSNPNAPPPSILPTPDDPELDSDEDGLTDVDEIAVHGTSPTVADTDGDGFTDFDEVVTKSFDPETAITQFNPRVADVPKLRVELVSAPALGLVHEESDGTVSSEGTERTQQTSQATTHTSGGSSSRAVEMTHTAGVSFGIEHEFGPTGGTSVNASISYEFSHSTTNEETVSWSDEQTRENSEALARIENVEQNQETTVQGGYLQMAVRLRNEGHIAFGVEGVTLSAFTSDPDEPGRVGPIGTLSYLDAGNATVFPHTVIEPGESLPPATFNLDLDLGTVKSLLADSKSLVISPATGAVTGTDGVDFGLSATNIAARTAQIIIDYGPARDLESHRVAVATNTDRPVVTVQRAFSQFLRIPFETGGGSFVYGDDAGASETKTGLLSVRGVALSEENSSYWIVSHTHAVDNGAGSVTNTYNLLLDDYDFGSLTLAKGDVLHLVYVEDTDRDGLGNRAELLYGTFPDDADSDDDGLSDSAEVNGWLIDYAGEAETFVTSDPLDTDSDNDGTTDLEERDAGTHPRVSDIENTPPVLSELDLDVAAFSVTLTTTVDDADDDLAALTVDWGDGSEPEVIANPALGAIALRHEYAREGDFHISVMASDALGESHTVTSDVTTTLPQDALVLHAGFDDGIVNLLGPELRDANDLPRYVPDRFGNLYGAMDLFGDGNREEYEMLSSEMPTLSGDFTFAIWVKIDHPRSGVTRLMGQGDGIALFIPDAPGDVAFGTTDYEHQGDAVFAIEPTDGSWVPPEDWTFYVGVATEQGAEYALELFRDAASVATARMPLFNPPACRFYVGHYPAGRTCDGGNALAEEGFPGDIDDVRIYDRALSVDEINALYHEGGYVNAKDQ